MERRFAWCRRKTKSAISVRYWHPGSRRSGNGFTQAGLAEKLGYSDKSISKWERGDGIPDVFCLKRMADLFGVTVDALLTEESETVPAARPATSCSPTAPAEEVHAETAPDTEEKIVFAMDPPSVVNHWAIGAVTFVGIWLVGALCFLIGIFCQVDLSAILVAAWPVSLLVMLIFNSLWGKHARTFWFCSGFIIGLLFPGSLAISRKECYNGTEKQYVEDNV